MTIRIDGNRAMTDMDYAKDCYLRSLAGENIDKTQIKDIENQYKGSVKGWKAEASNDQNSYEIDDIDKATLTRSIEETAKNETLKATAKYKGKTKSASKAAIVDAGIAVVGTAGSIIAGKVVKNALIQKAQEYGKQAAKNIIGAGMKGAKVQSLGVLTGEQASNLSKDVIEAGAGNSAEEMAKAGLEQRANSMIGEAKAPTGYIERKVTTTLDNSQYRNAVDNQNYYYNGCGDSTETLQQVQEKTQFEKQGESAGIRAADDTGQSTEALVGCLTAFATGTKYAIQRPNKDEVDELTDELQPQLESGEVDLDNAEENMVESNENIDTQKEEAEDTKEESEKTIEEIKKEIEEKEQRKAELINQSKTEELSDSEKAELETLETDIAALNEKINTTKQESAESIEESNEEIKEEQETMTEAQDTVDTIQDVADYTESFDKSTRTMAIVEAASQGLNAFNGTKSAAKAFKLAKTSSWAFGGAGASTMAYIIGGMGLAGAAASTAGVVEQISFVSKVNKVIDARENVQQAATTTAENVEANSENLVEESEAVTRAEDEVKAQTDAGDTNNTTVPTGVAGKENEKQEDEEKDKDKYKLNI